MSKDWRHGARRKRTGTKSSRGQHGRQQKISLEWLRRNVERTDPDHHNANHCTPWGQGREEEV